jgi:hypothetical protein
MAQVKREGDSGARFAARTFDSAIAWRKVSLEDGSGLDTGSRGDREGKTCLGGRIVLFLILGRNDRPPFISIYQIRFRV